MSAGLEAFRNGHEQMARAIDPRLLQDFPGRRISADGFNSRFHGHGDNIGLIVDEHERTVLFPKLLADEFSDPAITDDDRGALLGLGGGRFGLRGRPGALDQYDVYVQSTSYNRVLKRGTRFLYEVEDWDRGVELFAAA